jgi:DNA (cytosine-5)-methyltransferase 1
MQQKVHSKKTLPKIVSLFSGAGGLDLGFAKEGFEIPVAIDISPAAVRTHSRNFQETNGITEDLLQLGPKGVLTLIHQNIRKKSRIGVIGGPPCQGFSRANNTSEPTDPRNKLALLYVEIIKRLQRDYSVEFVVFENVLGIKDKKHAPTFKAIMDGLASLEFDVSEQEMCALDYGVPQTRRRIVLAALRSGKRYGAFLPRKRRGVTTVHDAIGHLKEPVYFSTKLCQSSIPIHPNHWTMQPKSVRFTEPQSLRSDGRSFKRLIWDRPSPTIAFGNREIHVHPSGKRRLSIYEAMLLQGFPHSFVLEGNLSEQVQQISNAVPPPLARTIANAIKRSLFRQHI